MTCTLNQLLAAKKWREKNKKKVAVLIHKWYLKNKEKRHLYNLKYNTLYKDERKKQKQEWYKENREDVLKQKESIKKDRNKENKKRRKIDINFKIKLNLRTRLHHALQNNYKSKKTLELLGCSIEFLKKHLESKFTEQMNWDNYGTYGWHIDHVKQCALFDLSKPEEQKECFHYSNLRPLWFTDNLSRPKPRTKTRRIYNGL